jgi:hypothetical protein
MHGPQGILLAGGLGLEKQVEKQTQWQPARCGASTTSTVTGHIIGTTPSAASLFASLAHHLPFGLCFFWNSLAPVKLSHIIYMSGCCEMHVWQWGSQAFHNSLSYVTVFQGHAGAKGWCALMQACLHIAPGQYVVQSPCGVCSFIEAGR